MTGRFKAKSLSVFVSRQSKWAMKKEIMGLTAMFYSKSYLSARRLERLPPRQASVKENRHSASLKVL